MALGVTQRQVRHLRLSHQTCVLKRSIAGVVLALMLATACSETSGTAEGPTSNPVTSSPTTAAPSTTTAPQTTTTFPSPTTSITHTISTSTTTNPPVQAGLPTEIRVPSERYFGRVRQDILAAGSLVGFVDGVLAKSDNGELWTVLEPPEFTEDRLVMTGDTGGVVIADGERLHTSADLVSWTTWSIPSLEPIAPVGYFDEDPVIGFNSAEKLFAGIGQTEVNTITEEDRAVYRELLDPGIADQICSVSVEYLDEAAVRFYDCGQNQLAEWTEVLGINDPFQTPEFHRLAAAGGKQHFLLLLNLETGDIKQQPISSVYNRWALAPVADGVLALSIPITALSDPDPDRAVRTGQPVWELSAWTETTGWVYGDLVDAQNPPGFYSPMMVTPNGSILLNIAEEGPRPISIAALLQDAGIADS